MDDDWVTKEGYLGSRAGWRRKKIERDFCLRRHMRIRMRMGV